MEKFYFPSLITVLLRKQYLNYKSHIFFTPKIYFMRKFTLRIILLCLTTVLATASFSQTIISGGTYSQNFNGIGAAANAGLPAGWKADAITTPRTVGSYATAQTTTTYSDGNNMSSSNNNGGVYNFGAGPAATATDRAVGGLNTSSNPTSINVYVQLTNVDVTSITDVFVAYDIEKYRDGKNADSSAVQLYYYNTTTSTWVNAGAPFYKAFAPDGDNNGFPSAPGATVHVSATYHLPVAAVQNGLLTFAWNISTGVASTGADASNSPALGIDNVRISSVAGGAIPGLYFQTHQSGDWSDVNTWESSPTGTAPWTYPATYTPTYLDKTINILHTVTVTSSVMTDQTTVSGNVIINSGVSLSVNDGDGFDITVNGTVSGAGNLVIKSVNTGTDAGTASVGPSTGTVTAPTTVERLLNSNTPTYKSAWRLLTAPLSVTGSIFSTWQNNGVNTSGIGTTVTGPTYSGAGTPGNPIPDANGLDYASGGYSMYTFDAATQSLVPVTNTITTLLSGVTNTGYYIFINGDRTSSSPMVNGSPNQTTVSATGTLQVGNVNFATSAAANSLTLIGNPYASAVDLAKFYTTNSGANINSSYAYWDPYLTTSYGVGGYVTVSFPGPLITPQGSAGNETQYLQSGQAMYVQTTSTAGASTVTFTESQKDATSVNSIFRTASTAGKVENLRINLNVVNTSTPVLVDGIVASFDRNYSASVDRYDARKMNNPGENLAFVRDGNELSVERRPTITGDDVLYLSLSKLKQNVAYQFEIQPSFNPSGLTANLVDSYLKTTTPVDLSKITTVNFTITGDAASSGANRFSIVFGKPGIVQAGNPAISVYPNPVVNGVINLQMNNMPQGAYNVRVFNSIGQVIATKQINHAAGSATETLNIKGLSKGMYQLEVVKPDNSKFSSKVMAN